MPRDHKKAGTAGKETPAALLLLKKMWQIPEGKVEREMPPPTVVHDIYCVPERKPIIPERVGRHRTSRKTSDF